MYPLVLASLVEANRSLIRSNTPVYVAGLERGVRPIGLWSIWITLSSFPSHSTLSRFPVSWWARFSRFARSRYRISFTRELFPEPDTPVTQVNTPIGNFTSMFFRLFSRAPRTVIHPEGIRLSDGMGICSSPERYLPVTDRSHSWISSAVPTATTSPPFSPAPGPISITTSAARIVSSSCSTTMTVFPRSRRWNRVASSLSLSR